MDIIRQLIDVLKEENVALGRLIKMAKDKTVALSVANIEGIYNIVYAEQELKIELDMIEKRFVHIVEEISTTFGISTDLITTSYIIDKIDSNFKEELELLQHEMQKKLSEYKNINDLNIALIQNNLNFVDYMFNTLSGQLIQPVIYGAQGYTNQGKKRNRFIDNKA